MSGSMRRDGSQSKKVPAQVPEDLQRVHQIWLAGLGALAEAEKMGSKLFSRLVDRGREAAEHGQVLSPGSGGDVEAAAATAARPDLHRKDDHLANQWSQAETAQLRRNAQARKAFLAEFGTLTSREVAEHAGSHATNRAALANRWKSERRIFAVAAGGQTLFPAFQFSDDDGRPNPVIAEILTVLQPRLSDWQTALWFTGRNGWLGAKRPVDLIRSDPAAVAAAARHEAEAFD